MMTDQHQDIAGAYREAIVTYLLHAGGETALARALEVGRQALGGGLSVWDLTSIHHATMLDAVLGPQFPQDAARLLTQGDEFLSHSLVPYELTHRGFADANARLRELNEVLEQRVVERTEALRESEERFRRLAENAPDAIYRFQFCPSRDFTYMSPAVTVILGYAPEEFYADPDLLPALAHSEDRDQVRALLDGSREPPMAPATVRLLSKDSRLVWLEIRHVPIVDEAGILIAVEGIARDITKRRQAEEDRERLLEREQAARAEAEAVRLREAFLAVAAHEMKTPVTSLRAFAQLLIRQLDASGSLDPALLRRTLDTFERQSERLARLASQLLDVTRMDVGELPLNLSLTDISRLAGGVVTAAQATTRLHILRLRAPGVVHALIDPQRIEQVITNLVDNAIKYSPSGGSITVTVRRSDAHTVRLTVRDHGIGIPSERRAWIFDRFYQAHMGQHLSGVGLGLYICYQIVQLHGGRIWAEYPADGGTRIVVVLPGAAAGETPPETK